MCVRHLLVGVTQWHKSSTRRTLDFCMQGVKSLQSWRSRPLHISDCLSEYIKTPKHKTSYPTEKVTPFSDKLSLSLSIAQIKHTRSTDKPPTASDQQSPRRDCHQTQGENTKASEYSGKYLCIGSDDVLPMQQLFQSYVDNDHLRNKWFLLSPQVT